MDMANDAAVAVADDETDEQGDNEQAPSLEKFPWQKKMDEFVAPDVEDDRTIYWIYSIAGDVGKTTYGKTLLDEQGALVISPDSPKDVKHLICETVKKAKPNYELAEATLATLPDGVDDWTMKAHLEKAGVDVGLMRFYHNPIIIVDLSRTESRMMDNIKLYTTLENISGSFHSTKYEGGTVSWWKPPKLIVFANNPPNIQMLSPDRFQVYIIDSDSLDLRKDAVVDKELTEYAAELKRQQAARMEEIEAAEAGRDPRDETQEIFELVYEMVTDAKAERSATMHFHLKRAGYRETQKKMNEWIREFFADEIAAGDVKETRPQNVHCWKGLARRVTE